MGAYTCIMVTVTAMRPSPSSERANTMENLHPMLVRTETLYDLCLTTQMRDAQGAPTLASAQARQRIRNMNTTYLYNGLGIMGGMYSFFDTDAVFGKDARTPWIRLLNDGVTRVACPIHGIQSLDISHIFPRMFGGVLWMEQETTRNMLGWETVNRATLLPNRRIRLVNATLECKLCNRQRGGLLSDEQINALKGISHKATYGIIKPLIRK